MAGDSLEDNLSISFDQDTQNTKSVKQKNKKKRQISKGFSHEALSIETPEQFLEYSTSRLDKKGTDLEITTKQLFGLENLRNFSKTAHSKVSKLVEESIGPQICTKNGRPRAIIISSSAIRCIEILR